MVVEDDDSTWLGVSFEVKVSSSVSLAIDISSDSILSDGGSHPAVRCEEWHLYTGLFIGMSTKQANYFFHI